MTHDPATCSRSYCPECDAYGDGYSAGTNKAFSEVSTAVQHGGHAPDCGCQPRRVVAAVVRWPKLDPEHAAFETLLADVNTLDTL